MIDFDPRDGDRDDLRSEFGRDRDDSQHDRGRNHLDSGIDHGRPSRDHAPDASDGHGHARERHDGADAREPGRGPASNRDDVPGHDARDRHPERWPERDRDAPHREIDARDVFIQGVDLPRGPDREIVHDRRGGKYTLRGSETRTLSTVGAFRVVSARDLQDHSGRVGDPRDGDLRHLREQGLLQTVRLDGHRDVAVVLTERGRDVLDSNRHRDQDTRQEFYAGLKREREAEHDAQIYEAYLSVAERLVDGGAHIERVVLDYELKREYQKWLHEHDGDRDDYNGHPDRNEQEIEQWALEHQLPYFDEQVHFPDVRVEYEDIDGRHDHEDVEVVTIHYRGAHGAAAARSGFACYGGSSARITGGGGGGGRGGGRHGGFAEEFWD